jgi:hypothetical protein
MSTTTIILVIAVAIVLAVAVFVFIRSRPAREEPIYHFNCPHCRRKLRYRRKQAGRQGACPRCRQGFLFPMAPGKAAST